MTLYHHQRSVKSDNHSKRMEQIKTKDDLQKKTQRFLVKSLFARP